MKITEILKKFIKWFAYFYVVITVTNIVFFYIQYHTVIYFLPSLVATILVFVFIVRESKNQTTKTEWIIMGIFTTLVIAVNLFALLNPSFLNSIVNSLGG